MKSVKMLPEGYKEIYSVDMQKDKRMSLLINLISLAIAGVLVVPALFFVPFSSLYGGDGTTVRLIALCVSLIAYVILHEAVHGISMKLCGTKKVRFGFTGAYAFAASDDYYAKAPYLFIALAPVVFWGIILAIITPLVPTEWFWVVYIVQIMNLSGAAGDFFVTFRFLRFPKDILVRDNGVSMTVYSKE